MKEASFVFDGDVYCLTDTTRLNLPFSQTYFAIQCLK